MDEHLKKRIMKCAYEAFITRGIKSVTMDNISQNLSISKRTLYEEFKSKAELVKFIIECMNEMFQTHCMKVMKSDVNTIEKLFNILKFSTERSDKEILFVQDIMANYYDLFKSVVTYNIDNNKNFMRRCIIQGCEEGYFYNDINIDIFLDSFFGIRQRNNLSSKDIISNHRYFNVFLLRSMATTKGINEINIQCKKNNINIFKE